MPVYIELSSKNKTKHSSISVQDLFNVNPMSEDVFFAFEQQYHPYQQFVKGSVERSDLVVMDTRKRQDPSCRSLEIKLTAIPDSTTFNLAEDQYSAELVFRPPAIQQLALSIVSSYADKRRQLFDTMHPVCKKIFNWRTKEDVLPYKSAISEALCDFFVANKDLQEPFVVQPIWKTVGKSPKLAENCLDVFIWSNLAFAQLVIDLSHDMNRIIRPVRALLWLAHMLYDFSLGDRIESKRTVSEMAYSLQSDKAFSAQGKKTLPYLRSKALSSPRIKRDEIRKIILDNGHLELSPERRFDAIIVNTPGLFQ